MLHWGPKLICNACAGDSGWSGAKALDQIGNPNAATTEVMSGLSTAQKNRVGIWKQPLAGFAGDNATDETNQPRKSNVSVKTIAAKIVVKSKPVPENDTIVRSTGAKGMLVPMVDVSGTDILLDISENATEHIPGSIVIPYTHFMNNGSLLSVPEISRILGNAGISRTDPVVVYGECLPCGGGPSPATYVYWMLKSLGQENVRVMDGTVTNWANRRKACQQRDGHKAIQKLYGTVHT